MHEMSNAELSAAIAARPAEKVTLDGIKARIVQVLYNKLGSTLTHCAIYLDNGFIVTGESACVSPENYDLNIGQNIAYRNAEAKLWPLFGFLLAEKKFLEKSK